jgi:2-C-methyl-D-erythritol 2,4-cyclodiphosphate synthase
MSIRFDAAARRAIDLAMAEVERLGHDSLDTGHLLIGLIGAGAAAADALAAARVSPPDLERRVRAELSGPTPGADASAADADPATEAILQRAAALADARGGAAVTDLDILRATLERGDTLAGRLLEAAGVDGAVLASRAPAASPRAASAPGSRAGAVRGAIATVRVGIGYDSHRFAPGGPMRLGGIDLPGDEHLAGHSDGDAVAHAITDAVLGAAGAGDIGEMFADTDPANRGRDSLGMLAAAVARVRGAGWRVQQVDVTVVAERPRIGPHREPMRAALARSLGIAPADVGVKGKSNEGMGWIGRGEGVACVAVATLVADGAQSG